SSSEPARATARVDGSHVGIATRHAENVSIARPMAERMSASALTAGSIVVEVEVDVATVEAVEVVAVLGTVVLEEAGVAFGGLDVVVAVPPSSSELQATTPTARDTIAA